MELEAILNSIEEIKIEDIVDKKFKLEDMVNIHSSLTLDNPLTYMLYLQKRPDLSEDEIDMVYQIIAKLQKNKKLLYELQMEDMHDVEIVEPIQNNIKLINESQEKNLTII